MPQLKRDHYTTGQMARVLGVCQQTVIRRIDAGQLRAFRMPGGARRCLKEVFGKYLAAHDIPLDRLELIEEEQAWTPARSQSCG